MKQEINHFSNQTKVMDTILKNKRNNMTKNEIKKLTPNKINVPLTKKDKEKNNQTAILSNYEEDTSNSMALNLEKHKEDVIKNTEKNITREEPPEEYHSKFIDNSLFINEKYRAKVKKNTEELTKSIKTKNQNQEQ